MSTGIDESETGRRDHWESLYANADICRVNWYQPSPSATLDRILKYVPDRSARMIDVGGGGSLLIDTLLDAGYQRLSVLDISASGLDVSKKRLGHRAAQVAWITQDVQLFRPEYPFDFWHDRAVFHFIREENDQRAYRDVLYRSLRPGGMLIISTFAVNGPFRCAGLDVVQYDDLKMNAVLGRAFERVHSGNETHQTPRGESQLFWYGVYRRK